jgi:hypothetical protein
MRITTHETTNRCGACSHSFKEGHCTAHSVSLAQRSSTLSRLLVEVLVGALWAQCHAHEGGKAHARPRPPLLYHHRRLLTTKGNTPQSYIVIIIGKTVSPIPGRRGLARRVAPLHGTSQGSSGGARRSWPNNSHVNGRPTKMKLTSASCERRAACGPPG